MITPTLRKAKISEKDTILSLYQSMIGKEGCAWNEFYPSTLEIDNDIKNSSLYVLISNNKIIGSVSVLLENELDNQNCFKFRLKQDFREIARVCISSDNQGKGLAKIMLSELFKKLKNQEIKSIHLSVFKGNPAAIKTYKSLGFKFLKEAKLYGGEYFILEKEL